MRAFCVVALIGFFLGAAKSGIADIGPRRVIPKSTDRTLQKGWSANAPDKAIAQFPAPRRVDKRQYGTLTTAGMWQRFIAELAPNDPLRAVKVDWSKEVVAFIAGDDYGAFALVSLDGVEESPKAALKFRFTDDWKEQAKASHPVLLIRIDKTKWPSLDFVEILEPKVLGNMSLT